MAINSNKRKTSGYGYSSSSLQVDDDFERLIAEANSTRSTSPQSSGAKSQTTAHGYGSTSIAADDDIDRLVAEVNYGSYDGFKKAEEQYNGFVSRLESYLNDYGKDYGKNKSNRGMFVRSLQDINGISADIRKMLDELDDYDLYDETKSSFKDALNELLKAADSASLDARSVTAAYNNPATQRIMQGYDEAAYSDTKWNAVKESPQMALYNAQLDALGGEDIGAKNAVAPYMWQLEESPVAQDRMLGELSRRAAGLANQYAPLTPEYQGLKDRALGYEEMRSALSAERAAVSDEALMTEIERLKGIGTETAISSVRQTIDELDAQAQSMKKYWDEQAYLNDNSGSAPDYEEYEELTAKIAKYESILNRLLVDKAAEDASAYSVSDSDIKGNFGDVYNPSRLFDRVNENLYENPYASEAIDYGLDQYVAENMSEDVKTSSYPIAQRPENYMTEEERTTYNRIYFGEGEEAANAYFERLKPILEARGAEQMMAEAKQFTEDYPNWAWVQARGANAMKPISSAFMVGDILNGEGVRENSAANMNTRAANFVDSYVPEVTNYTGNTKFLGRDLDQFLYGTVGSTVDSAVRMMTASFIGGPGAGASLKENAQGIARATGALMSLEVFPSVVLEEKEKGRSDTQAVLLGAVRAAIEGFTEKYSVELLFSPSKTIGGFLLKGAAAEGSEEIAATVLNGVVDIIAADRDNILQEWDRRTALGIDPIEALADILVERGESTLADGMSGALSGLLFSAGGAASGAMTPTTQSAERMAQSAEVTDALVKQALAENPNNRVALKAQEDLAAGKTISAKTVQKLIESNESVYRKDDQQTIASFVASELTNRGEVTAVNETANAIAKAVVGENLSDGGLRAIENSVFGKQLYSEVTGQTQGGEWLNQLRDNLDVVEIARPQIQRETKPTAAKRVTVKNADATTKDGTAVQIVGLEAQTDGTTKVKVKGSDGAVKVMAASELELNEISEDLIEGVAKFKGAAPAIYAAYMPTNDVGTYLNDVEYIVTAANGVAADNDGSTILDYLKNSKHISDLADVQIETIFNAALAEGRKALAEAQPLSTSGSGQFTYTAKRAESSLKGREAAATVFMQNLAKAFPNIDIEVFESTARMGKYIGEQGSYSDGKIRIDLNAGKNFTYDVAESAMLRTLSHELTHHLQRTAPKQYADLKAFVIKHLAEWNGGTELDDLISAKQRRSGGKLSYAAALDEVVADSCEMMLKNSAAVKQLAVENKSLFSKIRDFVKKFLSDLRRAFAGVEANDAAARYLQKFETEMQKLWDEAFTASVQNAKMTSTAIPAANTLMNPMQETEFSLRENEKFMQNAIKANEAKQLVPYRVMTAAQNARSAIAEIMRDPKLQDALNLPADLMGKTYFPDGAYNGTEENTLVCPRSMGAEELLDAVSEMIGRPLTVDECIEVSQFIAGSEFKPECEYCYVATDRKAYRAFLNSYIEQRDSVIEKYKGGMNKAALYEQFLDGRKDTKNMRDRFNLWIKVVDQNLPMMQASDLTNVNNLMHDIIEPGIKDQVKDAMKYAQSASWAKKRVGYTAYNGHILKWSQTKINQLNKGFGLRMYSFSDFSPAFILENMQMITDASVRGLKMMAYTKEADFVKIFAPTGININVSTFGFERNGVVAENAMQGVSWKEAQELRAKYPNVGITFVATNDNLVNWALEQDWIDVVIPYHLVRTGKQVAERLGFTNYTSESGDIKESDWTKGRDMSSIPPTMHNNDKQTYLNALEENHLQPRFKRWIDHPNYMKLVNETRLSSLESKPVQPKFDLEIAKKSLIGMIKDGGYFQHIGGSVDRMYEIAAGIAENINENTQHSDRDYSRAVKRDDMAAAARMVDEAANAALSESQARVNGKLVHLFHGSETFGFTEFDPSRSVENTLFFSDNIKVSAEYNNGKAVPQRIGKPFVAQKSYNAKDLNELVDRYRGYKGIQIKELTVDAKAGDRAVHVVTHTGIDRYYSAAEFHKTVWDIDKAYERGSGIYEVVLDMKRPLIVDAKYNNWDSIPFEGRVRNTRQIARSARLRGYDGVIFKNLHDVAGTNEVNPAYFSTVYAVFKPNQVFSADPVTYDNKGDVIPLSERFNPENNDIRYSERDYEAAEIANLENEIAVLERRLGDATKTGFSEAAKAQLKTLGISTQRAESALAKREAELGRIEERIAAEKRSDEKARLRKVAAEKRTEISRLRNKIESNAKQLEAIAETESMSRAEIMDKLVEARKKLTDAQRRYRKSLSNYRERRNESDSVKHYRDRVNKRIRDLQDTLITNSDKKHIPEMLKEPLGNFLMGLDTSSATKLKGKGETKADADMYRRTELLKQALERARNNTDSGSYLDLPDEFMERIEELSGMIHEITGGVDAVADSPINLMNSSQLKDLNFVLRTLQHSINSMNKMLATARFQTVAQAAESTISELDQIAEYQEKGRPRGEGKDAYAEIVRNMLNWKNTTPVYAFDRMGDAGKELFKAMWEGQSVFAQLTKEFLEFREKLVSNEQVREWSQDVQTIKLSDNRSVRMTTANMMTFYCLANRQQALKHLQTGGMKISTISYGKQSVQQARPFYLSAEDITKITNMVKGDAKRVADQMQKYMTERGSVLGNEISMARFGYYAFTEPVYFPIHTESSQIAKDTKSTQENSINRLLNMSFTKSTQPNADTSVVIDNIFDVFSAHMSDMAKYNAFALPVLDMIKWYDYSVQETRADGTQKDHRAVQTSIQAAYGKEALRYISTFLEDVNGADEGGRTRSAGWAQKLTSHYKAASVGANLRVAIQQPTSYWRAAAVLNPKYLAIGEKVMWHNTAKVKKEMEQYAGISIWKSLGFRDFNVGRSVREQIAGTLSAAELTYDATMEASMWLASAADTWTWCRLWEACKAEVKATQKLSGEALMQATADRFNDVIARTQVVDSVMTRSHTMRSKNLYDQLTTPFMAEPTLSYNVVSSALFEYSTEVRRSNKQTAWKKYSGKMARAFGVFTVTALWTGVFQSLADAFRDDDDYEEFYKKFLDALLPKGLPSGKFSDGPKKWIEDALDQGNFLSNMNIVNNIPGLHRELLNVLKGFGSEAMWSAGIENFYKACLAIYEKHALDTGKTEEATEVTYMGNMTWWGAIQKALQSASQISGLPIYNLTRDATALFNTTVQEFFGRQDIKILTDDPGTEGRIANAYADGFLTFDEAMAEMQKFDIASDVAYEKLMKAAGFKKYDALKDAIANGGDVKAVMDELIGYGIKEDLVESNVKSAIKDLCMGTEDTPPSIDKKTAKNMLVEYLGMSFPEAHYAVEAYGEENFSKYGDIRDAILNGGDVQAAMDELIEYGTSESDVYENIRSSIKLWYQGETKDDGTVVDPIIDKDRAIELLVQYGDRDEEGATELVTGWSLTVETGMKDDDVKTAFLNDELSTDEAINLRMTYYGQTEEEAAQTLSEWMFEDEFGFSYDDRNIRFRDGEISAAEMVEIEMDYGGRTKEEAQKNLVGKVMDGYKDGSFSESEAMSMLTTNGGLASDEATKKIRYADAVAAYPDADIDDAWVDEYYAEVESSGISFNTFIDYRTSVKDIKGEGKKENRMAVIDSLPISNAQKDALYYAEGWAASTIHEAPWH